MRICEVCNSEFTGKRSDAKYCSKKCRDRAYDRRKYSRNRNLEYLNRILICPVCNNEFKPNKYAHRAIYCSLKCQQKVIQKRNKENGNIARNKHNYYLKHMEQEKHRAKIHREQKRFGGLREDALIRDGYKCVICGATDRLEVHHKDGSGRNKDNANNTLENLQTLCSKCHCLQTQIDNNRLVRVTKEEMLDAISKTNTFVEASELLGLNYVTFSYKKKQLGIEILDKKKCEICGTEFLFNNYLKTYCSKKCTSRASAIKRQKIIDETRQIQYRNCIICGTKFEVGKYTPTKVTCSAKCGVKHQNNKRKQQKYDIRSE